MLQRYSFVQKILTKRFKMWGLWDDPKTFLEKMATNFDFDISNGDTFILLIDHDIASISSLTAMLKKLSYKVISVSEASEAVLILHQKQMDIVLVIANTQAPHIDSHSFYTAFLTRDLPLILINPEGKKTKPSNSLEKRACYFLEKPISEKDINNMLQHVLPNKSQKLTKISIPKSGGGNTEEHKNLIEAFRENLKRQRTSQSSLIGKKLLKKSFIASKTHEERRNIAYDERKNKTVYPVEIENKRNEGHNIDSNIGIRHNLWTYEHQIKLLSASSNLGDKDSHRKSLLGIMNDRTDIPVKNKYPFTLSNIAKNYFSGNSMWYSLKKGELFIIIHHSMPICLFHKVTDKDQTKERATNALKFNLGRKMDFSSNSCFGNRPNSSSMEADLVPAATSNIPPCNFSHRKSLLGIMNDRTDIQVKNKYPFTLSNIAKNYFSDKYQIKERDTNALKFNLGRKMDLSSNSCFGNIPNTSSMEADRVPPATSNIPPCNISLTDTVSYTNMVSNSLNSTNFLDHFGLPSSIGASNSGNATPPEANIEDISQVQQDACNDVPIEDMISFDTDVHEMDMQYVLGNNGSSEVNILSNTHVGHEAYNTPMEKEDHFHGDKEGLGWIDDVLNVDG
ncbi:hypothetical protein Bca4012_057299 [Brassica carinata]